MLTDIAMATNDTVKHAGREVVVREIAMSAGEDDTPSGVIPTSSSAPPPLSSHGKQVRNLTDGEVQMDEEESAEDSRKHSRTWACNPEGTMFWSSTPTAQGLPPGLYKCTFTDAAGHMLKKLIVSTDDLITLDDDAATTRVRLEIEKFWGRASNYRKMGLLHKRGILMWGDPGSGKTSVVQQLIQTLIKNGGVAIYADDPNLLTGSLQILRRIEPTRPAIIILEDFETLTERSQRENEWLSVLDGEAQIDNVVFLATTNYIEKLDKRFTDRPSRFDTVMKVPMPGAKTRAIYLTSKLGFLDNEELREITASTKGFSIAHLKELIVAAFCLADGETMDKDGRKAVIDASITRLRDMQKRNFKSDDAKPDEAGATFGFASSSNSSDGYENLDMEEIRRAAETYKGKEKKVDKKDESA